VKLEVLNLAQCETVRIWRNEALETLRTPYLLTNESQEQFWKNVVCNSDSRHRYWALIEENELNSTKVGIEYPCPKGRFVGMGGITNIQWENRIGEISLILSPDYRGKGNGEEAVDLLLDQAFNYLNLQTVFAASGSGF
jgi:RimJ/RimL family protein N-acetyltransferase